MSSIALTAKYRPQTFADVVGQDMLTTALSRAALEDKVAPAYLFSGTRGVGKTTLARIFAKALNCRNAPTAEPCNACDLCRAVTMGNAVDVVEIDGASNRGIDDIRRLKEVVGYAPMDGRYKIFIIDEAHMLSREAFNALLKTLEEPPARVTFIMATTEPHKFPATIISRCRHYVLKRLPEAGLTAHLEGVLTKEGVAFEQSAVRLIARRGAGSVRDAMSLLGQVLALGPETMTEEATRNVLGLAGQEAFLRLLAAIRGSDSLTLVALLHEMLDQGLDMGFFLRELSSLWRNLFILRQCGEGGLASVDLPENEARRLLEEVKHFSLSHLHACWQMTLEGQRRVLTSLEPALALELLLLNLAMLPELLSLEALSSLGRRSGPTGSGTGSSGESVGGNGNAGTGGRAAKFGNNAESGGRSVAGVSEPGSESKSGLSGRGNGIADGPTNLEGEPADALSEDTLTNAPAEAPPIGASRADASVGRMHTAEKPTNDAIDDEPASAPAETSPIDEERMSAPAGTVPPTPAAGHTAMGEEEEEEAPHADVAASVLGNVPRNVSAYEESASGEDDDFAPTSVEFASAPASDRSFFEPTWQEILTACGESDAPPWFAVLGNKITAQWVDGRLEIFPAEPFLGERLSEPSAQKMLAAALSQLCGASPEIRIHVPASTRKDRDALKQEMYDHPLVREMEKSFGARIVDFGQMR